MSLAFLPSPPKAAWLGLALGVVTALATQAPAIWLSRAIESRTGGRIAALDVRGSVWQGSARLALVGNTQAQILLPGRVQWQLRLRAPWILAWQVHAECCIREVVQGEWRWSLNRHVLRIEDSQSTWPLQWLEGLGAPWNTVQPSGDVNIQSRGVTLQWQEAGMDMRGQIEVQARRVATQLSPLKPLGDYALKIMPVSNSQGQTIALELTTLDGALKLTGQGQWRAHQLYFRGEAIAQEDNLAALSNLLNVIGQRRGDVSVLEIGAPS